MADTRPIALTHPPSPHPIGFLSDFRFSAVSKVTHMIDDPAAITSPSTFVRTTARLSHALLVLFCTVLSLFGAPERTQESWLGARTAEIPLADTGKARATPPTLEEALQSAAGVYFCELRDDGGHPQLYVSAVWLHYSRLGTPPSVGSKLLSVRTPPTSHPGVKELVVFYYNPPVRRGVTASYIDVVDGRVPMFKLSVEATEEKVRSASSKN